DHVPERARLLVVLAAALDADRLGHGDLDVVDEAVVPERLEEAVREPEDEDVLDGLLPEVVVDPVDLALREGLADLRVERPRGGEVAPEGLLDHDAAEAAAGLVDEACRAEV